MSEEKVLILLLVVAGIIALIYFIYKSVQDKKERKNYALQMSNTKKN